MQGVGLEPPPAPEPESGSVRALDLAQPPLGDYGYVALAAVALRVCYPHQKELDHASVHLVLV